MLILNKILTLLEAENPPERDSVSTSRQSEFVFPYCCHCGQVVIKIKGSSQSILVFDL